MPFTTWIRDLFGIRKDVIDTKKAKLEITKLEDEEGERRGLIEIATLDDVKEYDPKYRAIQKRLLEGLDHVSLNGIKLLVLLILFAEVIRGGFELLRALRAILK